MAKETDQRIVCGYTASNSEMILLSENWGRNWGQKEHSQFFDEWGLLNVPSVPSFAKK